MGLDLLVFRDSNWSPDFPTAARQSATLYRPGHPVALDGVIALDQQAVQALVGALGPLTIPGSQQPVTGANVLAYMRRAWAPENGQLTGDWWTQRKSFMGPLAAAAWQRLQSGQGDWKTLAKTATDLLAGKHLLVYLNDPAGSGWLARQGWDGALRLGDADGLAIIDANVGYNKAAGRVNEAFDYRVDLDRPQPQAVLSVAHTHTGVIQRPCQAESRYDPVYDQMMDRCYWDYLQVYVPPGTRLLGANAIPLSPNMLLSGVAEPGQIVASAAGDGPWQVLGGLSVIAPGSTQTRTYTLALPASTLQWQGQDGSYALHVAKQPGSPSHPLTLRVRLPAGSSLLDAEPPPTSLEGGYLVYHLMLDRDRDVRIRFRRSG
jgi:hypothetical protein